jgi:beta-lactamase regulating signal transducer with metallopeptidase domain
VTDAVLMYAVNAAWQIPLVVTAALALTRIARPPPPLCSRLLSVLLFLAALLPALPFIASSSVSSAAPLSPALNSANSVSGLVPVAPLAIRPGTAFVFAQWEAFVILAVLAMVISIAGARLIFAAAMTRIWLRQSRKVALSPAVMLDVERFAERSGIEVPAVRLSPSLGTPAVVGIFRHTVIIPEHLAYLEPEALQAVLLHECAHIARRDYVSNWACEILSLPVCWHPLLYILKRELRTVREVACDQMAAESMASPVHYATRLLQVAQLGLGQARPRLQLAPALIGDGDLHRRIEAIMSRRTISRFRRMGEALVTGALFLSFGTLVALLRITPAVARNNQNQPNASPPSAIVTANGGALAQAASHASVRSSNARSGDAMPTHESFSDKPVTTGGRQTEHAHEWVSRSGRRYAMVSNDPGEPSDEQKRLFESRLDKAHVTLTETATAIEGERREIDARAAMMDSRVDIMRSGRAVTAPTNRIRADNTPPQARKWSVVRPQELPIVARGNQALKVLPDGTVLFSEAPDG